MTTTFKFGMNICKRSWQFSFVAIIYSISLVATAQNTAKPKTLNQIIAAVDTFNVKRPVEQLFLHLDKPYYSVGDTIWLKAYLFERASHAYSTLSGLMYVELVTDSNKVVKRICLPLAYGLAIGQIDLNSEIVPQGNYTIRAYTNWMQNFGEEYFYHQPVTITNSLNKQWLVKENHSVVSDGDKKNLYLTLHFTNDDNRAIKSADIDLRILNGRRVAYKGDATTNAEGIISTQFQLPSQSKELSVLVQDKKAPLQRIVFPLHLNTPENIDLQFMPEGGNMVVGLQSKIGFKAIAETGLGTDVSGKIIDSKNKEVATFNSLYKGMGTFELQPVAGEKYSAVITTPPGAAKVYDLPVIKNVGTVIRIDDQTIADSIRVTILFSGDMTANKTYNLVGLSRGVVCYGAKFTNKNSIINIAIPKTSFPTGIAHITLMNDEGLPLNERMVYIDKSDNLQIDLASPNTTYNSHDSIPYQIQVKDKEGHPVEGSFSLAVTDDNLVKTDTLIAANIVSNIMFSAELKGAIETPQYYFNASNSDVRKALDVLLLTQGWVGYNWTDIYKPPVASFKPQPALVVAGVVTNLFNKPVSKAHVVVMTTGNASTFVDTLTNAEGRFLIPKIPLKDTLSFFVQARNAKGKSFGTDIHVDEFIPSEIKSSDVGLSMPWNVNSDPIFRQYMANNVKRIEAIKRSGGNILPDVIVRTRKRIRESFNLNGPGEADQIIDENDINSAGKMDLYQLLQTKIKGFMVTYARDGNERFKILSKGVRFIIDGVDLNFFERSSDDNLHYIKETLEAIDAIDVKGIEVMNSYKYTSRYSSTFLGVGELMSNRDYAFIEITTRSGIFPHKVPATYVYRPIPITFPRQFYSPKYTPGHTSNDLPDLRSTIFWQPNIVTNKQGVASTHFYAADTPGTYTIIIQGSDINGLVGYKRASITITPRK